MPSFPEFLYIGGQIRTFEIFHGADAEQPSFVSLAWIFFRADSVYDAFYMIRYMGYNLSPLLAYHKMGMVRQDFYLIIGSVSFLFLVDFLSLRMDVIKAVDRLKAPVRWAGYLLLACSGGAEKIRIVGFLIL